MATLPPPEHIWIEVTGTPPPGLPGAAVGVVASRPGLLVMIRSAARGWWEFAGGRPEPGESPEDTARREVFEEVGARVGPLRLLAALRWGPPHPPGCALFYAAPVVSLEPLPAGSETLEVAWVSPAEARARIPAPWRHTDLPVVELALHALRRADPRDR